ncbi:hypothetical protein SAMN04490179_2360 [Pseudomonas antarctica]|uniref:Uncharacterized protein n=1 Tax=Pseudomonas antarctica TaxID=219572 RepID=A0A1G9YFC2_9PSED|nr:hypothetical protein [Pseudomonas antarctica]KAF2410516.1 hypothetical protein PSAN_29480 [Pseudomonas antarctica]SDN07245.1 hypothetical protein SAMN04490179_2360 [Pseudomonas antarctica]
MSTPMTERFPYHELFEKLAVLRLRPFDVLLLPAETTDEEMQKIVSAAGYMLPHHTLAVRGDVQLLDETAMNNAGWYRAPETHPK